MTDPQTDIHDSADQGDTPVVDGGGGDQQEAIRRRAYEISQSEDAGTPEDNWERAEREITGS